MTHRWRQAMAYRLRQAARAMEPPPAPEELRAAVGGEWDEMGKLQYEFLIAEGLRPEHAFLDVGCGVLRGGLHFIRYLDKGNYYGIDADPAMIEGAKRELYETDLEPKDAHLRVTKTFDVAFDRKFDFAIAQSVFSHLKWNSIFRALAAVSSELAPAGRFYATFFRGPEGAERFEPRSAPAHEGYTLHITTADADPFHYAFADFEYMCQQLRLEVDDIGDWGHPRGQQMLRFTRRSS